MRCTVLAVAGVGCLALLDPGGESPKDRRLEAYASRATAAYVHAAQHQHRC